MNILIAGVGGQGTLLASRIIGHVAVEMGYDVKVSEVHGMSQRGGSVVTYVKFGDKIYSPIIDEGDADIILAFEELEAFRYLPYLKKNGKLLVNTQKMDPMPVITGAAEYPEDIIKKISNKGIEVIALDALKLAQEAGSDKAVNVVLIGVLAANTTIDKERWLNSVKETVPAKFIELNIKAFEKGFSEVLI